MDVALSAPGKVLLAGGYLVLDRSYSGLVFALDARIHVHARSLRSSPGVELSEIIVRSPQFRDAEWRYGYHKAGNDGGIVVTQLTGSSNSALSRNVFIQTALAYALTYISTILPDTVIGPSSLTVLADNSYYSQQSSSSSTPAQSNSSQFVDFHTTLSNAHKTGLGSSAALVTAFTASVLAKYLPRSVYAPEKSDSLSILHNLAQTSHCAAQGKVGSGFDVAAAVYGSCVYTRFSPALLDGLSEPGSPGFAKRLQQLVEQKWDFNVLKDGVAVPKGLRLVMCDVDCGSQTVGMVKKVLAWRKENPEEAQAIWNDLQTKNETLRTVLLQFAARDVATVDLTKTEHWKALRDAISSIRVLIRKMSKLSGVPIEPPSQTALLDSCSNLPGVAGGVVPGAGGYDAVALLVVDKDGVLKGLQELLEQLKVPTEQTKDEINGGRVKMLGVREEMQGIRVQEAGDAVYAEWIM